MEELIQFLVINYIPDEHLLNAIGIGNDPLAIEEYSDAYRTLSELHLSLVCCIDNEVEPENVKTHDIIAAHSLFMNFKHPSSTSINKDPKAEPSLKLWKLYTDGMENDKIYDIYNIDRYLAADALIVLPKYRGCGLAVELMNVRDEVCRSIGVKVTACDFTINISQNIASKCGYKTYFEQDYDEIGKFIDVKFPDHMKVYKKMAKVLD